MSPYETKIRATIEVLQDAIEIARNQENLWQAVIDRGSCNSPVLVSEVQKLKLFQQRCQKMIDVWKSHLPSVHDDAQENSILHKKYYVKPILEAIETHRGQAELEQVSDYVYKELQPLFSPADFKQLEYRIRWQNQMEWTGHILRNAQLMKSDSPRGFWEISSWGRLVLHLIKELQINQLTQINLNDNWFPEWEQYLWEFIMQAEKSYYMLVWEYILPILHGLKRAGGKASQRDILIEVKTILQNQFQPADRKTYNGLPHWEKTVLRFLQLLEWAGLIAKKDQYNWQLTPAGEQFYALESQNNATTTP